MKACNQTFIRHAMAAFFASAWADAVEENGRTLRGEVMEQLPRLTDPAAIAAGKRLLFDMLTLNACDDADALLAKCPDDGDRDHTLEMLGHYAAMQAMGHGVGLGDAFGDHDCLRVPYIEFSDCHLERSYA